MWWYAEQLKYTENVMIVNMSIWIVLLDENAHEDGIELVAFELFEVASMLGTDGAQMFVILDKLLVIPID